MKVGTRYRELDLCLDDYTEWYIHNQGRIVDPVSCTDFLGLAINGRLYILHLLRDELMALRTSDTSDLDSALDTFSQWYVTNAETITDAGPMLQFLKKATDDTLHLLHLMRTELREYQGRQAESTLLWLPPAYRPDLQ